MTVSLYCAMSKFVPFWSSRYSILGLSVERRSAPIHFALSNLLSTWHVCQNMTPFSTCVKCLDMCTNSRSLLVNAFAVIIFLPRWLNPIDVSLGFGEALHVTGECPPVACARGRPQLVDCRDGEAPRCFGVKFCGNKLSCVLLNSTWYTHKGLRFPGCRDGTCTSTTKVPADSNTSIPVTGPILTWSSRRACNLECWGFLGSGYSLPSITDSLLI